MRVAPSGQQDGMRVLLGAVLTVVPCVALAAGGILPAEHPGAIRSGSMVVVADASACDGEAIEAPASPNRAGYRINFLQAGTRYAWLRVRQPVSTQRSILVTIDATDAADFADPGERFDLSRGARSGYVWERVTLRGSGSAAAPEQDPRVFPLASGIHTLDISIPLPDYDVRVDAVAITTRIDFVPDACDAYVEPTGDGGPFHDGGPVGGDARNSGSTGDAERIQGGIAADCQPGQYYDLVARTCQTPAEPQGCAAAPSIAAVAFALAACLTRRRQKCGRSAPKVRVSVNGACSAGM